jgi:hypothetical protein
MSTTVLYAAAGMGQKVEGVALVAKDGFSARYDPDRVRGVSLGPTISWQAKAMSAVYWFSTRQRAASPLHGCYMR